MIEYRYREDELIQEFLDYINETYQQHYVTDGKQTMDSIIANGHGTGFCMGNIDKYKDRYGKKGESPDEWRKDLIKVMHYTLFQLYIHDKKYGDTDIGEIYLGDLGPEFELYGDCGTITINCDYADADLPIGDIELGEI